MSEKLLSEKSYPTEQTQKHGDRENQPLFLRVAELMPDYAKNWLQEQRQSLAAGLDSLNTNSLYESAGKSNASHRNLDALTSKDEKVNKDLPGFMSDRLDEIKRATKGGGCFDGLPKEQYKIDALTSKDEKVNKDLPGFMSDRLEEIKRATKGGGCFDGLPKEQYKTELLHKSGENERR